MADLVILLSSYVKSSCELLLIVKRIERDTKRPTLAVDPDPRGISSRDRCRAGLRADCCMRFRVLGTE